MRNPGGSAMVFQSHALYPHKTVRGNLAFQLARLHRRLGATMLHVTHDQKEALTLGRRVALLREGALEQLSPPLELYERPLTEFAARFIGSPTMNVLDAEVSNGRLVAGCWTVSPLPSWRLPAAGTRVRLGIRPHDLALTAPDGEDLRARRGRRAAGQRDRRPPRRRPRRRGAGRVPGRRGATRSACARRARSCTSSRRGTDGGCRRKREEQGGKALRAVTAGDESNTLLR